MFIKLKGVGYKNTEFIDRFDIFQKKMDEDYDICAIGLDGRPFAVKGYGSQKMAEEALDDLIKVIDK